MRSVDDEIVLDDLQNGYTALLIVLLFIAGLDVSTAPLLIFTADISLACLGCPFIREVH